MNIRLQERGTAIEHVDYKYVDINLFFLATRRDATNQVSGSFAENSRTRSQPSWKNHSTSTQFLSLNTRTVCFLLNNCHLFSLSGRSAFPAYYTLSFSIHCSTLLIIEPPSSLHKLASACSMRNYMHFFQRLAAASRENAYYRSHVVPSRSQFVLPDLNLAIVQWSLWKVPLETWSSTATTIVILRIITLKIFYRAWY